MTEWKNITRLELEDLYYNQQKSDREIAEMFDVSRTSVGRKRKKFNITFGSQIYKHFAEDSENNEILKKANLEAKTRLLQKQNLEIMSKGMTLYIMGQTDGKLLCKELEKIKMDVVNRIYGVLTAAFDGKWLYLEALLSYYMMGVCDWETAEPDMNEMEQYMEEEFNKAANNIFQKGRGYEL